MYIWPKIDFENALDNIDLLEFESGLSAGCGALELTVINEIPVYSQFPLVADHKVAELSDAPDVVAKFGRIMLIKMPLFICQVLTDDDYDEICFALNSLKVTKDQFYDVNSLYTSQIYWLCT